MQVIWETPIWIGCSGHRRMLGIGRTSCWAPVAASRFGATGLTAQPCLGSPRRSCETLWVSRTHCSSRNSWATSAPSRFGGRGLRREARRRGAPPPAVRLSRARRAEAPHRWGAPQLHDGPPPQEGAPAARRRRPRRSQNRTTRSDLRWSRRNAVPRRLGAPHGGSGLEAGA